MNKDQINGSARALTGKVQEAAGKVLDNKEMQTRGLQNQVIGNAEKAISEAKKGVKPVTSTTRRSAKTH